MSGQDKGSVAGCADAQSALPRHEQAGSATPSCVWIVMASTGEYSDRSEWTVYSFFSKATAQAYVDFLGVKYQELGGHGRLHDWEQRGALEKAMEAFDPRFQCDYTGTHWWVEEVPFAPPEDGSQTSLASDGEVSKAPQALQTTEPNSSSPTLQQPEGGLRE